MSNHKTPSIRFKGFTDDWEQRKLGNVIEIAYQGINTTADKVEYVSEGVPILQGKHITSGKIDYKDVRYLDKEKYESVYYPKYVPKVNDILLANIGTIGPLVVMKPGVELLIAWNIMLIRLNKMGDVKFVKVFLDKLNNSNFYESIMRGNATKFINKDGIMSIEIPYPTICEQEKIGAWFEQLDNLITLHQRKYEKLVNVKKSMLDKMFPKNDFKVPEIRFKGFTDDWEQRKLGDVVSVYDGVHQTPDYKDNGIMFLSVENIATLRSEKYISEEAFKRDYKIYPQKGDILMTRIGDVGTPNVVETSEKVAFYVSLALLKPSCIDSYFLCNAIQSPLFQKGLKDRTLVTAIPQKINKDEIGKVDLILPVSTEEQTAIGEYFKNLDHLITLHQRELEKLQNLKKSLLNSMFI